MRGQKIWYDRNERKSSQNDHQNSLLICSPSEAHLRDNDSYNENNTGDNKTENEIQREEDQHDKYENIQDSEQPAHLKHPIRVTTFCTDNLKILQNPNSKQQRF